VADVPAAGHESAAALLRHDSRISALENSASEYKARQHVLVKADELEQALVARDAKLQALTEEVDELGRVRAEEGALLRVLAAQVTDLHHRANQAEAAQVRVHSSQKAGATPLLQLWC
jgi:glutamate mutase epsilon subunit